MKRGKNVKKSKGLVTKDLHEKTEVLQATHFCDFQRYSAEVPFIGEEQGDSNHAETRLRRWDKGTGDLPKQC